MFRYIEAYKQFFYLEIGPQLTYLKTLTEEHSDYPDNFNTDLFSKNTVSNYNNYKSIVVGAGIWRRYAENGFQVSFSLDNMMKENKYTISDNPYKTVLV